MNTKKLKALAYVRISSVRQIDNESPDTQRAKIQAYADANNIEILDWFYDEAQSGKNADRKELNNLLEYALNYKKDKIDHVIVYKMNRASRDLDSYFIQIRAVLKARGITIRSATEQVDDTVIGRFMEMFYVLMGQLDNENKAEYTKDNMKSLALQGYWQHPPILGYDPCKVDNNMGKPRPSLKPNAMAEKVTAVLERFSKGGITKAELTRYAAKVGLRSRYGNKLSEDRIHRLLTHPVYAGYVSDNFTDYELVEGKHIGLISKQTFERNQALLEAYKNSRMGEVHLKPNEDYELKGLLLDANCGKAMYASAPKSGNGSHFGRYHCARKPCRGKTVSVKADVVHKEFGKLLEKIKPSQGLLKLYRTVLMRQANQELDNLNMRIKKYRRDLDQVSEARSSAVQKFVEGSITLEEKKDVVDALDKKKMKTTLELNELEQQQTLREADIEYALNFMENLDKLWHDAGFDMKQRFQKMIFPDGVVFDTNTRQFGTTKISPLYRYIPNEKASEEALNSNLVAGAGLEPATSWL